jgi:dTDP-3-amino-3,4,6-trideoxy-alpha-D-glucose transaminase
VLVAPVSAFATALAAIKIGAHPVFVDCDRFGLIDLDAAHRALAADHSIHYAVPVHLYGHCINMERLADLKQRFGLRMVEDCAQSIGASCRGIPCGSVGDCAATSFYPTKNLGALGDGGALLTNSEALAAEARSLRDYGQVSKYRHEHIGYNSRLDELHAAILDRVLLPRVQEWNTARRSTAEKYLAGIRNPVLTLPGAPQGSGSCWHLFPLLTAPGRKAEFLAHLSATGICVGEHYPAALMDQPAMAGVPYLLADDCATARDLCAREVSLPMHPYLEADEIERVIEACNSFF